ncbi:hypothetical protein FDP41_013364 [Naegleria fowleri]|uniref:Uncharacterized protein n=1 Tax=Naegleria fowleri TaxID=5763 RepID=A0A6A5C2S1_NAEFO|nr:uncharacterized protein FDP41_013364 [Naegleria fowleri]KAF0980150.1 hypothetical protein FDP41_013364 [Naegleria fowleri]
MTAQPQVSYSLIDFSRFLRKALNVPEIGSHCKCIPKKKVLHNAVFNVIGLLSQTISSGFDIVNEWKKVSSLKVKVSKDEFNSLALSLLCSRIPSIALSFVSPRTFSQAFKGLESEQNFYENNFFVEENPERDDLEKLFQVLSKLQPNLSNETMNEWKELILNPSPQNSQTCEDVILIEANMSSLPPSTKEAPTQESCQDTRTTGETEQTTHEQQPSRDSLFPMSQNQIELSQDPVLENSTPPSKTIPFGTGDINTPQQTLEEDEISYNFDEELEEEEDTSNNKLEQNSKKQKISVITSGSVKLREQRKFLKELKKIKKLKLKRRQTMFDTSTSENYHPTPGHQRRKTHHGKTDISKNQPLSKSIKEIVDKSDLIQVSSSTPSVHDFAVKEAIHKAAPEIIEVLKQYLNAFPSPNMDLVQVMSTIAQKLQNHPNFYHRLWNFLKTEDGSSSTPNPTQPPSSSTIEEPEY